MSKINTGLERRYFDTGVQLRAAEDGDTSRTIEGYAFKYEVWSRKLMGWFYEKIARGAADDIKFDEVDILALFNHSYDKVLARTISNTLQLENDEIGLRYWFDAPNNTAGNDLLESVKRGDIQHSSFAFITAPGGDSWTIDENGDERRTLLKFAQILDVSPVTNPAYLDTTVAKRSFEQFKSEQEALKTYHRREMARRKFELMFNNSNK